MQFDSTAWNLGRLFKNRPQTAREEFWNTLTSGVGALLALAWGAALLTKTTSPAATVAVFVYLASLIGLYAISSAYHATQPSSSAKALWQKLDHCAILTLIAGTYTPFAAIGTGGWNGTALLAMQWITAAFGCILQFASPARFRKISTALYVFMGWGAFFSGSHSMTACPREP